MRRREVIAGLAGGLWSFASGAETKLRRLGVLRVGTPPPTFIEALRKGLRDLGYVEGHNFLSLNPGSGGAWRNCHILLPISSVET